MTKKEFIESVGFTGVVQSSISEMKAYMRDFDANGLKPIVKKLEEALERFRKVMK